MHKVFIATTSFGKHSNEPIKLLKKHNIDICFNDKQRKLNNIEVKDLIRGYDGVIAGNELYTKETLSSLDSLKVISRLGVGLDNIDLAYAEKLKLKIFKTNTTPALAVAELALGLIIDLRSNSGGLLNESIKILDSLLPKDRVNPILIRRSRKKDSKYFSQNDPNINIDLPILLLLPTILSKFLR